MTFNAGLQATAGQNHNNLWFVFNQGKLLIKRTPAGYDIPEEGDMTHVMPTPDHHFYFGALDDQPCYATSLMDNNAPPEPLEWIDLRALFHTTREELFWVAGLANQLVDWHQCHRFCGRCGEPTEDKSDERAKICPRCRLINYPRLSPAVITAVLKNDRILLARNKQFNIPMFSVLAGFVEPGETLEDCVAREIHEEVGLAVRNIRYFGSQPWPFPNSLMIGFVADWADGRIRVDDNEIAEAGWFSRSDLPPIPPSISIARRLIDWFAGNAKGQGAVLQGYAEGKKDDLSP